MERVCHDYKCSLTPKQCIYRHHLAFGDEEPSNGNAPLLVTSFVKVYFLNLGKELLSKITL